MWNSFKWEIYRKQQVTNWTGQPNLRRQKWDELNTFVLLAISQIDLLQKKVSKEIFHNVKSLIKQYIYIYTYIYHITTLFYTYECLTGKIRIFYLIKTFHFLIFTLIICV